MLEDCIKKKDFEINHPSTTHDDGSPSEDVFHDCRRVILLIEDERLLVAQKLFSTVPPRLEEHPGKNLKATQKLVKQQILNRKKVKKVAELQKEEYLAIQKYLDDHRETLIMMEVSYSLLFMLRHFCNNNS
jgi:superfamily II RNA helicase